MIKNAAWITGGGTGIGRALAIALARDGWHVAVSGRRRDALAETAAAGPAECIHVYPLDVADTAAVTACAARIEDELGAIELAVFNAGINLRRSRGVDVEDFAAQMDVNYLGTVRGVAAVLPGMRARGGGRIVIMSSLAAYRGLPRMGAYGASKAALNRLAEALQCDFGREGVAVSLVTPGFVDTAMTAGAPNPMPFLMSAEKAATIILRGIGRRRFRIAFPWPMVWLTRLQVLLPYRLYFRLIGLGRRR